MTAPVNTSAPVLSGTPRVGQTLTVSNGTWSPPPAGYTYDFICDDGNGNVFDIGDTTFASNTCVVPASAGGKAIYCVVYAYSSAGFSDGNFAPSNAVGPVTAPTAIIIASTGSPYTAGTVGTTTTILVTPGTGSLTLPADFPGTFERVECWGSGTSGWDYSGGAGGGYSASTNVSVSGSSMPYKLAAGGVRDAYNGQGHGSATWAISSTTVSADGGDVSYDGGSAAPNTTNGYGAVRYNGGSGGADSSNLGGGSAATPSRAGAFAPGGATGTAGTDNVEGGGGGAPAGRGGYPGGGGGGGTNAGAAGRDGQIRLSYTPLPSAAIHASTAVQASGKLTRRGAASVVGLGAVTASGKLTQRARTSTLWTPAAFGSAVVAAWYDFSTGAATLNGAVILAGDRSGNNHGLVAPAGSGAPTPSTAINGLPTVHFNGSQYLYTNGSGTILSGSAAAVAGVAAMGSAGSNNGRLISFAAAGTADYNSNKYFCIDRNTSAAQVRIEYNGTSYGVRSVAYNTPMLIEAELTATTAQTFLNGVGSGTTAIATPALAVTEIDVGCRPGPADAGSGDAGEWLVFNRALTADERARVQGYLAWMWGLQGSLPATHAYKAAPPDMGDGMAGRASVQAYGRRVQTGSVTIGATTSVSAVGGVPSAPKTASVAISCQSSATFRGRLIAHAASSATCTSSLVMAPKVSRPAQAGSGASSSVIAAGRRIQYGAATITALGGVSAQARALMVGRSAVQMQAGVSDFGVKPPATRQGQATLAAGASVSASAKVTRYGASTLNVTTIVLPAGRYTASGRVSVSMQSAIVRAQQTQRLGSTVQVAAGSTLRASARASYKAQARAAISSSMNAYLKLPRNLQPPANLPRAQITTPAGAPNFLSAVVAQVNTYLGTLFATRPPTPPKVYDVPKPTDLPAASDYPTCIAWVVSLSRLVVSNGTNWLRTDTGAVVA